MRRRLIAVAAAVVLAAVAIPTIPATAAGPTKAQCAKAWYDYQYTGIAPGFRTSMSVKKAKQLLVVCEKKGLQPHEEDKKKLTQKAFNAVAQILEREVRRVSIETKTRPCEAVETVLKPVGALGRPLGPGDDVEGYAPDSFLPILKYNWYGGPFRLKFGVGCVGSPASSVWFLADPYPPQGEHPDRYPSDEEVKKDPWPRTPFEGPMSTCITWGKGLNNTEVGAEGFIFSFDWDRTNLPNDVLSCYPRAMGQDGLDKYPFTRVPNLPLP